MITSFPFILLAVLLIICLIPKESITLLPGHSARVGGVNILKLDNDPSYLKSRPQEEREGFGNGACFSSHKLRGYWEMAT